jgi:DNA-binding NarL/FixJ family response regulator
MNEPIYILADNQDLTRQGLAELIRMQQKDASIVSASNTKELKQALSKTPAATIIIDFDLFDFNLLEDLQFVLSTFPQSSCLLIAQETRESFIHEMSRCVPQANFALKSDSADNILAAISSTETHKRFFSSDALEIILGNKPRKTESSNRHNFALTNTEKEIVQLLAMGKSTKEIANERCLSYHTVITHRKNIFRKMEVNTVHELTKLALKYGLVDMTEYYI